MYKRNSVFWLRLVLVTSLLLSLLSGFGSASAKSSLQSVVSDMQPGWNLGNTLDATGSDETSWGNPKVTEELIKQIAAQGYKSIRIPVTWGQHVGTAPGYTIDPAYLDRVEEVVNWALKAKLYVMINVHHDSWMWISHMETQHDPVLAQYNAIWTQVADRFKNASDKLIFESINEPRFTDGGTTDETKMFTMLDELNTSFLNIVRNSGGRNATRPLVLPTLESSPNQVRMTHLYEFMSKLDDPNLIATVHYYGFWPFSVNIAGYTQFEGDTVKDIDTTFSNVYNTFTAKGIPVIVGEYGLLGFDKGLDVVEQGEKLKFFEYLTNTFKQYGITGMLWDNGQHFGRTTFQWSDPDLYKTVMAGVKGRSSTASSDLIFLLQGEKIKDTQIALNLNGNAFTGLRLDEKALKRGKDYTIDGSTLTLKAELLSELTKAGTLGQSATLTAQFNKGADWKLNVILYKTPLLSEASGTASSFAIPVKFNGDRLATMEAINADGSYAGPQGWTAFKEFGYAFSPSYSTGEIKLLPAFFNEVKDGTVTLKFHFWSGNVLNYTITKSGSTIVGSPVY